MVECIVGFVVEAGGVHPGGAQTNKVGGNHTCGRVETKRRVRVYAVQMRNE